MEEKHVYPVESSNMAASIAPPFSLNFSSSPRCLFSSSAIEGVVGFRFLTCHSIQKVRTIIGRHLHDRHFFLGALTLTKDADSYCYGNTGRIGNGAPGIVHALVVSTTGLGVALRSDLLERFHVNASGSSESQPGSQVNLLLSDSCKRRIAAQTNYKWGFKLSS